MSVRFAGTASGQSLSRISANNQRNPGGFTTPFWIRPSDWPALDPIVSGTQKIQCLIAVRSAANSAAMSIQISGAYTVDWGDGTSANFASGATASKIYDYSSSGLGPVTSQGFKTAILTITPQSGQNITSVSLFLINPSLPSSIANYAPIIELYGNAPNMTTFTNGEGSVKSAGGAIQHLAWGLGTVSDGFRDFYSMAQADFPLGQSAPSGGKFFDNCYSLQNISGIVSLPNLSAQFRNCKSLAVMPSMTLNTASIAGTQGFFTCNLNDGLVFPGNAKPSGTMNNMFNGNRNLRTFPDTLDMSLVTNTDNMFNGTGIKKFINSNMSNVTSAFQMFNSCTNLQYVANLTTPALTSAGSMFNGCISLQQGPGANMALVTDATSMFSGCSAMASVGNISATGNCLNMSSMFASCTALTVAPTMDTSKVTNMSGMFSGCNGIVTIPAYNTANVTNFGSTFLNCTSMVEIPITSINAAFALPQARLSQAAIGNIFTVLTPRTSSLTITLTANPGVTTAYTKTATSTAGSTLLTLADTSNIAVGMCVTGTNIMSGVACNTAISGNLVTATAHGLSNGTLVSFAGTNVGNIARQPYYVINAATDTFQCSNTSGGSVTAVTTTGATTMFYPRFVSSFVGNTSVTLSTPAAISGSSSVVFRTLDTSLPLLKGWTTSG